MDMLIAVKQGNVDEARRLLSQVDDVNRLDDDGWTLLNWAAGRGDAEMVHLLVDGGADVFRRGRDNRTPYLIALAAGHLEVVKYLRDVETSKDAAAATSSSRQDEARGYCRAYPLGRLRGFTGWSETAADPARGDDQVVFLHQDYSVTASVLAGRDVIFRSSAAEWHTFCAQVLAFHVATDVDWLDAARRAREAYP